MADAATRLRDWNDGAADVPATYTPDALEFQQDLRALLAERDAAQAQMARMREALRNLVCINENHNAAISRVMGRQQDAEDARDIARIEVAADLTCQGNDMGPDWAATLGMFAQRLLNGAAAEQWNRLLAEARREGMREAARIAKEKGISLGLRGGAINQTKASGIFLAEATIRAALESNLD